MPTLGFTGLARPRTSLLFTFADELAQVIWNALANPVDAAFGMFPGTTWCPGAGSNHRHCDFQSHALPTELPGHFPAGPGSGRFIVRQGARVHHASPADSRSLIRVFVVVLGGRNSIGIRQPAIQVDIPAALGAERSRGLGSRLATDRAGLCRPLRLSLAGFDLIWRLSWHSTSRSESGSPRRRAARPIRTAADPRHWCKNRPF